MRKLLKLPGASLLLHNRENIMQAKEIKPVVSNDLSYTVISLIAWAVALGVIEIFVSELLSNFRLPYRGLIITFYIAVSFVIAKFYNPSRYSIFIIALIIVVMKAFYYQSVTHPALYAVVIEGIIAEIIFMIRGINYSSSIITATGLMIYTFLHGWIMHGYFIGTHIFSMYKFIFIQLLPWANISDDNITLLMIIAAVIHLLLGFAAGIAGWFIITKIEDVRIKLNTD